MNETKRKVIAAILWVALILLISAVVRSIAKPSKQGNGNNASQEQTDQEPVELDPQDTKKVKPYGYDKPKQFNLVLDNDPVSDGVYYGAVWTEGGNGPDLLLTVNFDGVQTMRFKPVAGSSGTWSWSGQEKVPGFRLPGFGSSTRPFSKDGRIEIVQVHPDSRLEFKTYQYDENNPRVEIPHKSGILFPVW